MEAIFIIISQLLGGILAFVAISFLSPMIALILSPLAAVLEALLGSLFGYTKADDFETPIEPTPPTKDKSGKPKRGWLGHFVKIGGVIFALLLIAILAVNFLFFTPTLRWMMAGVKDKSGVEIQFESASGNFFIGLVELKNVTAVNADDPYSNFSLTAKTATFDIDVWTLRKKRKVLDFVSVTDVGGQVERLKKSDVWKPRKEFTINELEIKNGNIQVVDYTPKKEPVEIEFTIQDWRSKPLRSDWAVFDVLFRCNSRGEINGHSFEILTTGEENKRQTEWHAKDLPIETIAPYVSPALDWVETARIDLNAMDQWQLTDEGKIQMDYRLMLKDVTVAPPKSDGFIARVLKPALKIVNNNKFEIPINFKLYIDPESMRYQGSPFTDSLIESAKDQIFESVAKILGVEKHVVEDFGLATIKAVIEFAKRKIAEKRDKQKPDE